MNSPVSSRLLALIKRRRSRSGMALLLEIMLLLILTSALVISVMFNATKHRVTSSLYSNSVTTRILSNSVLNLVMGEIRDATSNDSYSWASQPGAIRTFNTSGRLVSAYKLYSSDNMVVSDASLLKSDVPSTPAEWQNKPAAYVNLNRPVVRSLVSNNSSTQQLFYPIADPSLLASNVGDSAMTIPGYDVKSVDGYSASDYKDRLPMPVKWLYFLKDGTLSPMANDGTIAGASRTNPIMGRVAFWTDDETAKVNLNTAGEGFYWTAPHAYSYASGAAPANANAEPDPGSSYVSTASLNETSDQYRANSVKAVGYDFAFAYLQPANREYNRYPGHPAQTCLSTVFPSATLEQLLSSSQTTSGLAPVYGNGGTRFGRNMVDLNNTSYQNFQSSAAVYLHSDRLYATVDDAAMQAKINGSTGRPVNHGLASGDDIRKREFLLTTRSRAPELNLFNRPRICMWPVDGDSSNKVSGLSTRTAFDNLIAFCSTIVNRDQMGNANYTWPFLFYRTTGSNYAGSTGKTNEMTAWRSDAWLNNKNLFEKYLKPITSKTIPGYGGSFQTKYGSDCNQILIEMLDYIRCTNICDLSLEGGVYNAESSTAYPGPEYTPGVRLESSGHNGQVGHGQAVPLVYGAYQGLGRVLTVSEVALHITRVNKNNPPYTDVTGANPPPFQATLAVELSSPTQGFPGLTPYIRADIVGADRIKVSGTSLFPNSISIQVKGPFNQTTNTWYGADGGGYQGPMLYSANLPDNNRPWGTAFNTSSTSGTNLMSSIPFAATNADSIEITVPATDEVQIRLYAQAMGDQVAVSPYQTISLPSFSSDPIATSGSSATSGSGTLTVPVPGGDGAALRSPDANRATRKVSHAATNLGDIPDFFLPEDRVYSIIPKDGDFRLTAAMASVPATALQVVDPNGLKHYLTTASVVRFTTKDLKIRTDDFSNRRVAGKYEEDVTYDSTTSPKGPPSSDMTIHKTSNTHDWSTGIGAFPDGPWSNFPDAGVFFQWGAVGNAPLYFAYPNNDRGTGAYMYDPYRQVCSPGMFGGLPTGVKRGKPWQTLLFRPQASGHPDTGTPPDHLFMDLFWMPVVEPYAISEPFSTAGKINLNTEIVPFTYLKRQTGIYAVMKSEKIPLIHKSEGGTGSSGGYKVGTNYSYYYDIDIPTTLRQFDTKFDTDNDLFRSASQICEIYLAPKTVPGLKQHAVGDWSTPSGADSDWYNNFALTGENLRERPYVNLYSRLTTQSNTYRVHFWVETVKKAGINATPNTFIDPADTTTSKTRDAITGRMRGSFFIERYIDYNDSRFGKGINPMTDTLTAAYRYRVLEVKQFNP